jgi:hypothetical protein
VIYSVADLDAAPPAVHAFLSGYLAIQSRVLRAAERDFAETATVITAEPL